MDVNLNMGKASIETNRELSAILSNFSDDYIEAMFQEAMAYKFRPYTMGPPNYPYLFESQFKSIMDHWEGGSVEPIQQRREDIYLMIIDLICKSYDLERAGEIAYDHLWPLCYKLYELFVSDFTNVLIGFFTNYIYNNAEVIIGSMSEEQKTIKSNYSKVIYTDPSKIILYDNMDYALDSVASLDINFDQFIHMITDQNTANMISMYIADCGNVFRKHFSNYVRDPLTKTEIITSIKVSFMKATIDSLSECWIPPAKE